MQDSQKQKGYMYAFLAYFFWGFFPIYWKFLKHVPTLEILCHRVIWAFVFYCVLIFVKEKKWNWFWPKDKKQFIMLALASTLLMTNWLLYIYAVNSNQIVESSLGYFITPFVNFLLGVVVLKEQLQKNQKIAIAIAAIGVLIIGFSQARPPWIALVLAITFSFYGLIKKTNKVSGLSSNQFESFLFAPLALGYVLLQPYTWVTPQNSVVSAALLLGAGLVTGIPLIFFAEATQRIPYSTLGFFQFLAPTLQFLTGVMIFHEELSMMKLFGFIFIWISIGYLIFSSRFRS